VSGNPQFADSFTPCVAIGFWEALLQNSQTAGDTLVSGIMITMLFVLGLALPSFAASIRTKKAH